jgi:hypothetical protein
MTNAYVTVDPDGDLALGSMVTVEDEAGATLAFNEVPHLDGPAGLSMTWERVIIALKETGWQVDAVGGYWHDGDVLRFDAVKL